MQRFMSRPTLLTLGLTVVLLLSIVVGARAAHIAEITGIPGAPDFVLAARSGHISTADGNSLYFWGYSDFDGTVQYPGPTLVVTEGDTVTIRLTSHIPEATSIVIPGFDVTATGGVPGMITREAPPDRVTEVTYTFSADRPGTFMYYSGTHTDLQTEMGLMGALIVRPDPITQAQNLLDCPQYTKSAYGDCRSAYDQEYLFLLSEMDMEIHDLAEQGRFDEIDTAAAWPVYWFINGRTAPDTMNEAGVAWLPNQPYNCMPMMEAGQRMLLRHIGGGRDMHPFHTHGNNFDQIARDGHLLEASTVPRNAEVGTIPNLSVSDFGLTVTPGATYDSIFTWTGKGLNWDIYDASNPDHMAVTLTDVDPPDGFDDTTYEYIEDHGKPLPVQMPGLQELTFGAFYSGSPYLGAAGSLPPGEGGNNPNAGFVYMWHSHNEKEMTNNDIFPGGLMTMLIVEAPSGGM